MAGTERKSKPFDWFKPSSAIRTHPILRDAFELAHAMLRSNPGMSGLLRFDPSDHTLDNVLSELTKEGDIDLLISADCQSATYS